MMNLDISDPECDVKLCWEKFRMFCGHTPIQINYHDIQKWAAFDGQTFDHVILRRLISAWVSLGYMIDIENGWWRAR